jgi:hypothetical protein
MLLLNSPSNRPQHLPSIVSLAHQQSKPSHPIRKGRIPRPVVAHEYQVEAQIPVIHYPRKEGLEVAKAPPPASQL